MVPDDGDFVAQHEEFDVFRGGRAAHQQDQSEHLPEDQVQQAQRHSGITSGRQSPLVIDASPTCDTPHQYSVGFQNPDAADDQRFQGAGSYSLSQPPRTRRRRIGPWTRFGALSDVRDAAAALAAASSRCIGRCTVLPSENDPHADMCYGCSI